MKNSTQQSRDSDEFLEAKRQFVRELRYSSVIVLMLIGVGTATKELLVAVNQTEIGAIILGIVSLFSISLWLFLIGTSIRKLLKMKTKHSND